MPVPVAPPSGPESPTGAALLVSPVRRAVVDELASLREEARTVGLTAAELGDRLGLHTTTIRFHVDQLVAAGVLEAHFVRSGGVGRPSKRYLLHEQVLARTAEEQPGPGPYEVLAGLLASAMSAGESEQLTPEEAGVRWALHRAEGLPGATGTTPTTTPTTDPTAVSATTPEATEATAGDVPDRDATVEGVIDLLAEWGYTPETEPAEGGAAVDITLRACPFLDLAHTHPDVVCGVHRGLLRGALGAVGRPDARVSLQPFVGPDTCRARLYLADAASSSPEDAGGSTIAAPDPAADLAPAPDHVPEPDHEPRSAS